MEAIFPNTQDAPTATSPTKTSSSVLASALKASEETLTSSDSSSSKSSFDRLSPRKVIIKDLSQQYKGDATIESLTDTITHFLKNQQKQV